jgi:hypothetical protein
LPSGENAKQLMSFLRSWPVRHLSGFPVTRSYTDQDGRWQDSGSFMVHHIPLVVKVLEHAYAYMHELQRQGANGDEYGDAGPGGPVPFDVPEENSAAYAR